MCYWHSLEKTVGIVEAKGLTKAVFKAVCDFAISCKKKCEVRASLYGLLSMLEEPAKLPPVTSPRNKKEWQANVKALFRTIIDLCDRQVTITENEDESEDSVEHTGLAEALNEADDESFEPDDSYEEFEDVEVIYDPVNPVHELYYVKCRLEEVGRSNMGYYKELEQGLTEEEKSKLAKAMSKADECQRELVNEFSVKNAKS